MLKYIYKLMICLPALMWLASCNEDITPGEFSSYGTEPVVFMFDDPEDMFGTRGVESYKQYFEEDDLIHVSGTFKNATGEETSAYGAFKLENRKWVPVETPLYWPIEAVSGDFTAYYIAGNNGPLGKGFSTDAVFLSDVTDKTDPLVAKMEAVKYGAAVNLHFTHVCTYLTIEKLESNVSDYFWMVGSPVKPIHNAYSLTLNRDNTLTFNFVSEKTQYADGLIYISKPAVQERGEDGQLYSAVSYYLEPGDYSYFDLRTNNNFPFMSFQNSLTEPLEANHPYILNVINAKGANYTNITEKDWDETNPPAKIDVPTFLQSVAEAKDYTLEDKTEILKKINGSLVLMCNVDFQFYDDYSHLTFKPDVSSSTVFEGNLHYIHNVGYPIFRFNYGTVQNLGIKNVKFDDITLYEGSSENDYANDFSRAGVVCDWNRGGANIKNVRLENATCNLKIQAENPYETRSNENFSVGGLCGQNDGNVSEIDLKGNINITVGPSNSDGYTYVDANVYIGGLIGNHTSNIWDVGPEPGQDYTVNITSTCKGRDTGPAGVYNTGGAIGVSTANQISQIVIQECNINLTDTYCYQQYAGGLVGRLRGDLNSSYYVSDCTVQGTIRGGRIGVSTDVANTPTSYIGGFSGNSRLYTVSNCRSVCEIYADKINTVPEGTYATGGFLGRIQSGTTLISNSAYGTELDGPQSEAEPVAYVGIFAGISRDEEELKWPTIQANGNTARAIDDFPGIGAYINSTESTEQ